MVSVQRLWLYRRTLNHGVANSGANNKRHCSAIGDDVPRPPSRCIGIDIIELLFN